LKDRAKQIIFSVFDAFLFSQGENTTQTRKNICAMYGEDAVSKRVSKLVCEISVPMIRLVKIVSAQVGLWWLMMTKLKV